MRVQREASFQLGAPRLQEFARAVASSRRTLLVLSPAFMADGVAQFVALLAQHYGLDTRTWPVIPLTLQTLHERLYKVTRSALPWPQPCSLAPR